MHTLTKVDPMSWAKVQAVMTMLVMAVMWLLQLVLFSSVASFLGGLGRQGMMGGVNVGGMMAGVGVVGLVIMVPVVGGFSFIFGYLGALVFNLVLKWLGGVKFEMKA